MEKVIRYTMPFLAAVLILAGCSKPVSSKSSTAIVLSDEEITVGGAAISTDENSDVYVGADIIYYEEGKDETYGEGSAEDTHSADEAGKHKVITITKPGTYKIGGKLSAGQIVIDLGDEAKKDSGAAVNLVLDNAEISCSVAPAILILNAYECGSDNTENATPTVDTTAAGFNLILAKDSKNIVNGAYVAKIYKDGTTKEDVEKDEAKKKYKFDAAIDSQVSFNIASEENASLTVNAKNEGISGALHMTINGGNIVINSADDSINTSEDSVSVLTVNGGVIICNSGLGDEGDGIDSNGYITMNGGYVIACANAKSQDSGIDSDLGIYINGGTLLASGNMYDEVSKDSSQQFAVLSFSDKVRENELIMIADEKDNPVTAFSCVNDYTTVVCSFPELTEGTYHLYKVSSVEGERKGSIYTNITDYKDAVQLQYTIASITGGFGGDFGRGEMPEGMEFPEGERLEMPEGIEFPEGEMPKMPERTEFPEGEHPEMPEGTEFPEGEMKDRGDHPMGGRGGADMREEMQPSTEFVINRETYQFGGITEK